MHVSNPKSKVMRPRTPLPFLWITSTWLLHGSGHVPKSTSRPRPQRSGIGLHTRLAQAMQAPEGQAGSGMGTLQAVRDGVGYRQESSSWLKHNRSLERLIINSSFYNREPEVHPSEMINPSAKQKIWTSYSPSAFSLLFKFFNYSYHSTLFCINFRCTA